MFFLSRWLSGTIFSLTLSRFRAITFRFRATTLLAGCGGVDVFLFVLILNECNSLVIFHCICVLHEFLNDFEIVDLLVHAASFEELLPIDLALVVLGFTQAEDLLEHLLIG